MFTKYQIERLLQYVEEMTAEDVRQQVERALARRRAAKERK